MAYKGKSSFGISKILYTYQACKTLFGPIKHKSISLNGPTKARAVSEKLQRVANYFNIYVNLCKIIFDWSFVLQCH